MAPENFSTGDFNCFASKWLQISLTNICLLQFCFDFDETASLFGWNKLTKSQLEIITLYQTIRNSFAFAVVCTPKLQISGLRLREMMYGKICQYVKIRKKAFYRRLSIPVDEPSIRRRNISKMFLNYHFLFSLE